MKKNKNENAALALILVLWPRRSKNQIFIRICRWFCIKESPLINKEENQRENEENKNENAALALILALILFCDRDRIQTCNPQSRNLMRYSIAPRSLFKFICIKGNISALKAQAFLICFLTFGFYCLFFQYFYVLSVSQTVKWIFYTWDLLFFLDVFWFFGAQMLKSGLDNGACMFLLLEHLM